LDLVFKIAPISDHVAKFRGDRLRDRGDLALKKKKEINKQRNSSKTQGLAWAALTNMKVTLAVPDEAGAIQVNVTDDFISLFV